MTDVAAIIARVRRAMPRNADVMAICDEAERQRPERPATLAAECPVCADRRAKKAAAQARYRRKQGKGK